MDSIVLNKEEIFLNSNLGESAFGKTNYFTLINEKGCIFSETDKLFTDFTFEGVKAKPSSDNNSYVYYYGKNPLSIEGKTLSYFFDNYDSNSDELYKAVTLTVKAITNALDNDKILPLVGGDGIIVDIKENKVLFLPELIFKNSTNVLNDSEYYKRETAWLNGTIKEKAAMSYERGLIVYRLLTTQFPYKEIDEEKRNADILDKNFVPLENIYENIDKKFSSDINKALMLNSTTVAVPGKKVKGIDASSLNVKASFDFDELDKAWNMKKESSITDEDLEKKTNNFLANKKAKVEASRKLRRNRTAFIIALCVTVIIVLMTVSGVKRQNAQYTTMGLESTEVIQNFFYGVNNKSLEVLEAIANGEGPDKYVGKITEVFLAEKQITGFTKESPFFYPEKWFYTITNNDRFNIAKVFGITNLTIDGNSMETFNTLNRRNEKPNPVEKENGKILEQNDTVTHNVSYYLIQTDLATQNVVVSFVEDMDTLTYKNGKWLLTNITSTQTPVTVDTEEFKKDYFTALDKYNGNIVTSCDSIREKYSWIPTTDSLIKEGEYTL